jgi:hypothetical protein
VKTVVVPDVHLKIDLVHRIDDREGEAAYLFLGDFFDDFDDCESSIARTAEWLQDRASRRVQDTFLLGNHDAWYLWPEVRGLMCSGNDYWKKTIIRDVLDCPAYWARVKLWHEVPNASGAASAQGGTWLLSHAGFHADLYRDCCRNDFADAAPLKLDHAMVKSHATRSLEHGSVPAHLAAGRVRGGHEPKGGVTWLDWNHEFAPIDGVNQIVGHTRGTEPRNSQGVGSSGKTLLSDNWCLDSDLRHYGVIEDGVLRIEENE